MKRFLGFVVILAALLVLAGCEGRLYGVITSKSSGNPLEGVSVSWQDNYVMTTNTAGEYDVPITGGTGGFLKFEKAGYKTLTNWHLVTGSHKNDYEMESTSASQ